MLRKVYIVIDVKDDAQREYVQQIANEVSEMRLISGDELVAVWPFVRKHESELMQLFGLVKNGGAKALMSVTGMNIVAKLVRR